MTQLKKRYLVLSGVSIGVAALAVSTFGVASADTVQDPAECEVTELPFPEGGVSASLHGLSPNGEYSAGATTMEGEEGQPPTLWQGAEPEAVEVDEPGEGGHFWDVNDSGDAVGTWFDDKERPLIYRDGEVSIEVPGSGFENSRLLGINNDGDIVGHTLDGSNPSRPFVWRAGADEAVELSTPEGTTDAYTADINQDGTIAGYIDAEDAGPAFAWDDQDNPVELPQPEAPVEPGAIPMNIAGDWAVTGQNHDPVRWNLSDLEQPTAENLEFEGQVSAVSPQGWVAGFDEALGTPALRTDEATIELPLPDETVTNPVPYPVAISDDGTVINGKVTIGDAYVPTVWTCQ